MSNIFYLPDAWVRNTIRVLVIGCGGTGCEVVDALARMELSLQALGRNSPFDVTLCDGDDVSRSNIGRQRFGFRDLGKNKATVLAARYNAEYGLTWTAHPHYCNAEQTLSLSDRHSHSPLLVITAVDRASFRASLGRKAGFKRSQHAGREKHLWLDLGNGASTGQAVLGHLHTWPDTNNKRLPNVLNLFPNLPDIADDAEPSCSLAEALRHQQLGINRCVTDPAMFGILMPLLSQGSIRHHGVFIDMLSGRTNPLLIDQSAWDFMAAGNARKGKARRKGLIKSYQSATVGTSQTECANA